MPTLGDLVPDVDVLLQLRPEELAGALLLALKEHQAQKNPYSFWNSLFQLHREHYPREHQDAVSCAIIEAWSWLEREGLIAEEYNPTGPRDYFVTRRAQAIESQEDFEAYRKASLLPKEILHPLIAEKVWTTFMRGDHDIAVFQAFKEVEVAVRSIGGFGATDIGVPLMRKAFNPQNGPLADSSEQEAEREALQHLFAGAIGSYKNPGSHRTVTITDPAEVVEMIMLASHLLRIVDARTSPQE